LYNLKANYGDYDPVLNAQGSFTHNEAGSQILGGGFTIPGSVSDTEAFSGDLGGKTPWGMTYDLLGNVNDTWGHTFGLNTNNQVFVLPFKTPRGSAGFAPTQPLLKNFWIDSTRLNIRVAKNRLKFSELTLKLQIMQTLTILEQAYYDLIYNRE